MNSWLSLAILFVTINMFSDRVLSQEIPGDPNHLPKMIGGRNEGNQKVDAVTVTGKIIIDGFPASIPKPPIYVAVYSFGRFVDRRQTSNDGSYSLSDVPRDGSTITVEIEGIEITSRQIIPSAASVIYQEIAVNWLQLRDTKARAEVVSAKNFYKRSQENQKLFEKALSALNEKSNNKARSLFLDIIKSDPKDFISLTQLANIYFLDEKFPEAESFYSRAIELKADYMLALINLGRLYIALKETEKAIPILAKAVDSDPTSPDAQQMLGEAYLIAKKGSKAVVYLNEAIRLAPIEKADIHLRLAALYDAAGLRDRAATEYRLYIQKIPDTPEKARLEKYITENSNQN